MSQSFLPRVERDGGVAMAACAGGRGGLSFPAITVQKGERARDDGKNTGSKLQEGSELGQVS